MNENPNPVAPTGFCASRNMNEDGKAERSLWFIRQAGVNDLSEIARIWRTGQAMSTGLETSSQEQSEKWLKNRLRKQNENFQVWVAINRETRRIIGWQSLCRFSQHPLMSQLWAESSTYIDINNRYRGVGRSLLQYALDHSKHTSLEYIFGFISANEPITAKLIESVGFRRMGLLPESLKYENHHRFELICYSVPR